jgi:hypothetical protein
MDQPARLRKVLRSAPSWRLVAERRGWPRRRRGAQPRGDLSESERLDHVVVSADVQPSDALLRTDSRRWNDLPV